MPIFIHPVCLACDISRCMALIYCGRGGSPLPYEHPQRCGQHSVREVDLGFLAIGSQSFQEHTSAMQALLGLMPNPSTNAFPNNMIKRTFGNAANTHTPRLPRCSRELRFWMDSAGAPAGLLARRGKGGGGGGCKCSFHIVSKTHVC